MAVHCSVSVGEWGTVNCSSVGGCARFEAVGALEALGAPELHARGHATGERRAPEGHAHGHE